MQISDAGLEKSYYFKLVYQDHSQLPLLLLHCYHHCCPLYSMLVWSW